MVGKQELHAVIQGTSNFSKQLYDVLSREDGNVFFSPITAHTVLAMAYQGADGSTKEAFTNVLSIPDTNQAAEGYKDLLGYLNNARKIQLLMANKIYFMEGYNLTSTFKEAVEKKFLSEVEAVNFGNSEGSAAKINDWVKSKTRNKIQGAIPPESLDNFTRLVLVNAIYFRGNWASEFDKDKTKTETFYLNDNRSIDVQMMNTEDHYFYKVDRNLDAKILELPYLNRDFSLIVILPNKRNGIAELEAKLASIDSSKYKLNEGVFKPKVRVKIPKFRIETTINLKEPLKELGLGVIFDKKNANFSGMIDNEEPLYVSNVIQKAFIEVNEEGTEAAAAIESDYVETCGLLYVPPPDEFIADHPFVVMLAYHGSVVDEEIKARLFFDSIVLFQGRVSEPNI